MPSQTKFPCLLTELALCMHISGEICVLFYAKLHHACFVFRAARFRLSRHISQEQNKTLEVVMGE